jgi:preprotein translocase subunit SecY
LVAAEAKIRYVVGGVIWGTGVSKYESAGIAPQEIAETLRASGLYVDGRRAKAKFDTLIKGWRDRVALEERASGVSVE